MKNSQYKKAFSLMELLIVILILGLLAGLVLPNLIGKGVKAKRKVACIQMNTIAQSLKMYKLDNSRYPNTTIGLKALLSSDSNDSYFSDNVLPKDPWKNNFIYIKNNNGFELISLGADGKENGINEDKDILFSKCNK